MKVSGREIRPIDLEFILIVKGLFTKVIGKITNKMDME